MMNVNECRIKELETQLNELKANNARLRDAIGYILDDPNTFRLYEHEEHSEKLSNLLNETQAKSLIEGE